eukprot:349737-Chlamydomonas_euryale.AAC.3
MRTPKERSASCQTLHPGHLQASNPTCKQAIPHASKHPWHLQNAPLSGPPRARLRLLGRRPAPIVCSRVAQQTSEHAPASQACCAHAAASPTAAPLAHVPGSASMHVISKQGRRHSPRHERRGC